TEQDHSTGRFLVLIWQETCRSAGPKPLPKRTTSSRSQTRGAGVGRHGRLGGGVAPTAAPREGACCQQHEDDSDRGGGRACSHGRGEGAQWFGWHAGCGPRGRGRWFYWGRGRRSVRRAS